MTTSVCPVAFSKAGVSSSSTALSALPLMILISAAFASVSEDMIRTNPSAIVVITFRFMIFPPDVLP
jgi:hypothetical protein